MGLFQELTLEAGKRNLDFLVIGGLAVIFYGYSRDTADLDLLIRRDSQPAWLELLGRLGYHLNHDAETFIQFLPPAEGAWPVDLMLVKNPTFDSMHAAGLEVEMFGTRVRIPALDHLLALKLHALKHTHIGRFSKDFLDVEGLVRVNRIDMNSKKMKRLFEKYGTLDLHEKISRATAYK